MKIAIHNTTHHLQFLTQLGYIERVYSSDDPWIFVEGIRYSSGKDIPNEFYKEDHYGSGPYDSDPVYQILQRNKESFLDLLDFLKDTLEIKLSVIPRNIGQETIRVGVYLGPYKLNEEVRIIKQNPLGQWRT